MKLVNEEIRFLLVETILLILILIGTYVLWGTFNIEPSVKIAKYYTEENNEEIDLEETMKSISNNNKKVVKNK